MNTNLEWNSRDYRTALAAVERIDDRELLARIAVEAVYAMVRIAAINKLVAEEHQPLLARIAETDEYAGVRNAAMEKLVAPEYQQLKEMLSKRWWADYFEKEAIKKLIAADPLHLLAEGQPQVVRDAAMKRLIAADVRLLPEVAKLCGCIDVSKIELRKLKPEEHQPLLARIAMTAYHAEVREAALEELSDQAYLADIALCSEEDQDRAAAIRKLNAEEHQPLLARIAETADSWDDCFVLLAAVQKLIAEEHQPLLIRIAKTARHWKARRTAMHKLIDRECLIDIARSSEYEADRMAAIEQLGAGEHQPLLAELVLTAKKGQFREALLEKLVDQACLADIVRSSEDEVLCVEAMKKLTAEEYQPLLAEIAKTGETMRLRRTAIEQLSDPACLADVIHNSEHTDEHAWAVGRLIEEGQQQQLAEVLIAAERSDYVYPGAIDKITDQACLVDIALRAKHSKMRSRAILRLKSKEHQLLLADRATEDEDVNVRRYAIGKLIAEEHQPLLARLATEDPSDEVRLEAIRKLIAEANQPLLLRIATTDKDDYNCAAAIEMLNAAENQPLLIEFASNTNRRRLAIEAVKKVADISSIPQSVLATIVASILWDDDEIQAITGKLTDQAELFRVAMTASDTDIRKIALCKLADVELLWKAISLIAEGLKAERESDRLNTEALLLFIYKERKESWVWQQIASYNGTVILEAREEIGEWGKIQWEDCYFIEQHERAERRFRVP
jgi:hypothetical protein